MYTRPEMTSPGTRVHNSKIYCYPGAGRFVYICTVYSVKKWKRNTNGLFSDAKDKYIRRVRITEYWSLICCAFFVI